jgi:pimeloyl-ACP methyl ester carboxylesterase
MNRAGYATIAIDMIGVGRSSHPPSAAVSINAEAYVVHEVILAARAGLLGGPYDKVIEVSHSIGTLTAFVEAATYQDVDALLATGGSHSLGALGFGRILALVRPALLDPVTRAQVPPLDFGYLSAPGARAVFYQSGDADPALVEADEATRSPVPLSLALTLIEYAAVTQAIQAPVLLANGGLDVAFCLQGGGGSITNCADAETLYEAEAPFFGSSAKFETYVLPNNGHNINLVRDAHVWYDAALRWFERTAPLSQ